MARHPVRSSARRQVGHRDEDEVVSAGRRRGRTRAVRNSRVIATTSVLTTSTAKRRAQAQPLHSARPGVRRQRRPSALKRRQTTTRNALRLHRVRPQTVPATTLHPIHPVRRTPMQLKHRNTSRNPRIWTRQMTDMSTRTMRMIRRMVSISPRF